MERSRSSMLDLEASNFFSCCGFADVELQPAAMRTILTNSVKSGRNETGGILIGRYTDNGRTAVIVEATPRPRGSRFGWAWFQRSNAGLNKILDQRWKDGLHYLGEWHFHPGGSPSPSGPDIVSMQSISSNRQYHCREPILLIIGGRPPDEFDISVTVHPTGEDTIILRR